LIAIAASGVVATEESRWLLDESNELSRIFNQSQLTARTNAAAHKFVKPLFVKTHEPIS
jgi:hypothetical protein